VRAFLREWESANGEIATAATAAGVAFAEAVGLPVYDLIVRGRVSFDASILSWIFIIIGVLATGLTKMRVLQMVSQSRGMMRAGFAHARIAAAQFVDEAERDDERQAADAVDRAQRREMLTVLGGSVLGTVAALGLAFSAANGVLVALGAAGAVALPTLAIRMALRLDADISKSPLPGRLLRGRLGRWIFRVAGMTLPESPKAAALEGPEPTALALGQAARELYLALPAATRAALAPDLLDLIAALERRALRANADRAGPGGFNTAVAALETIRLDLLRVSVHQLEPAAMTAELEQVRAMGDAVERRIAADAEVGALIRRG